MILKTVVLVLVTVPVPVSPPVTFTWPPEKVPLAAVTVPDVETVPQNMQVPEKVGFAIVRLPVEIG